MGQILKIAITTGDPDGIGTEVSSKALAKLKPKSGVIFYLWRSPRCPEQHLRIIDKQFRRITVSDWPEALAKTPASSRDIIDICSNLSPAEWVETSAKASLFGHIDALATAPMSKTSMRESGFKEIGHTEILKKVSKKDLFMGFIGNKFNVVLATGHLPIKKVNAALTPDLLKTALDSSMELQKLLPKTQASRPIGILGLNPHAGEDGLLGDEEQMIRSLIKSVDNSVEIQGPLVPDAAFFEENWKKFSLFLCMYHDQGLIPFKMVHGQDSGVHITLGLPFVRTSVDHGTAKDIFLKNKANASSMYEALHWAIKLAKKRKEEKR